MGLAASQRGVSSECHILSVTFSPSRCSQILSASWKWDKWAVWIWSEIASILAEMQSLTAVVFPSSIFFFLLFLLLVQKKKNTTFLTLFLLLAAARLWISLAFQWKRRWQQPAPPTDLHHHNRGTCFWISLGCIVAAAAVATFSSV